MSKVEDIADMLLGRNEDDPFGRAKVRSWNKHAKSVDAMPKDAEGIFRKKKKIGGMGGDPASQIRAANKVPEAVVKIASYGAGGASAKGQLDYISRDGQLELELSDGTMIQDKDEAHALIEEWENDFHYRKGGSRNTMHMVVSAPAGSSPENVLKAGREFGEAILGDNHPYAFVRHDDGTHPHVHFVVKMRGDDGEMLRIGPRDLQEMRETFAEKCRDNGIEMNATSRASRGANRSEPMSLRKMREGGRIPEIDSRAAKFTSQEKELPETAKTAMKIRQSRLIEEAKTHREIADALSSLANPNNPEGKALEREAEKLRELAGFLEEGGHVTRPERVRGLRKDRMAETIDNSRDPKHDDRSEKHDPVKVLDEARHKADRGVELARQFTDKLPPGEERSKAEAALSEMSRVADSLNGRDLVREQDRDESAEDKREREGHGEMNIRRRVEIAEHEHDVTSPGDPNHEASKAELARLTVLADRDERIHAAEHEKTIAAYNSERKARETTEPEREMKASGLDKNVTSERAETGPDHEPSVEPEKEAPAPGSNKERMQQIRERDAAHAKERERNPDADRDR